VADIITAMGRGELAPREANEMLRVIDRGAKIVATAEAAEAVAREGQPRHIEVTWVETKEIEAKWKVYWKEQYEALYGPLPELPDPEEDGLLPPEKAPAVEAAGVCADKDSVPAKPGGGPLVPVAAVARYGAGNNESNENNENTMKGAERAPRPGRSHAHGGRRGRPGASWASGRKSKRRPRSRAGGGAPRGQSGSSA
jgi:hypothetical protein